MFVTQELKTSCNNFTKYLILSFYPWSLFLFNNSACVYVDYWKKVSFHLMPGKKKKRLEERSEHKDSNDSKWHVCWNTLDSKKTTIHLNWSQKSCVSYQWDGAGEGGWGKDTWTTVVDKSLTWASLQTRKYIKNFFVFLKAMWWQNYFWIHVFNSLEDTESANLSKQTSKSPRFTDWRISREQKLKLAPAFSEGKYEIFYVNFWRKKLIKNWPHIFCNR